MLKKFLPQIIAMLFLAGFVAYAWTEPASPPPGGNAEAPINVSNSSQYKAGALGIGGLLRGYSDAIFDGNVGIGTTNPGAKLDVQGGDVKVGTATIKGDGTVSANLNADKLDGKDSRELSGAESKGFSFGARAWAGTNNQGGWTSVVSVPFRKVPELNRIRLTGSVRIDNIGSGSDYFDKILRLKVGSLIGSPVSAWQSGYIFHNVLPYPLPVSPSIDISSIQNGKDYMVEVELNPYNDDDTITLSNIIFTME